MIYLIFKNQTTDRTFQTNCSLIWHIHYLIKLDRLIFWLVHVYFSTCWKLNESNLEIAQFALQDTKFGCIITGKTSPICLFNIGESLEEDWKTIINNENTYGKTSKANQLCKEENQALEYFQNKFKRNDD